MSQQIRLSAANLADELTAWVRRGGQARNFWCHPSVIKALREYIADQKTGPAAVETTNYMPAGDVIAYITGIDIFISMAMHPGTWRLERRHDSTTIMEGYLDGYDPDGPRP